MSPRNLGLTWLSLLLLVARSWGGESQLYPYLRERPLATTADLYRAAVFVHAGRDLQLSFSSARAYLLKRKLVPSSWSDLPPRRLANQGRVAYVFYRILGLPQSFMLLLLGPTPRYCLREMQHRLVMGPGGELKYVSGRRLLEVVDNVMRYRLARQTERPIGLKVLQVAGVVRNFMKATGRAAPVRRGDRVLSGGWLETSIGSQVHLLARRGVLIQVMEGTRLRLRTYPLRSRVVMVSLEIAAGKLMVLDYNKLVRGRAYRFLFSTESRPGKGVGLPEPYFVVQRARSGTFYHQAGKLGEILDQLRAEIDATGTGLLSPAEGRKLDRAVQARFDRPPRRSRRSRQP